MPDATTEPLEIPQADATPGEPYHAAPRERPPRPPNSDEIAIAKEIMRLQQQLADLRNAPRPMWHCKRCGQDWRGQSAANPPLRCARCASAYWMKEPLHPNARRPTDPPNPRWRRPLNERQKAAAKRLRNAPPPITVAASPALETPRGITTTPAWLPIGVPGLGEISPPPRLDDTTLRIPQHIKDHAIREEAKMLGMSDLLRPETPFQPPPRLDEPAPESFAHPAAAPELEVRGPRPDEEPPELDPDLEREVERLEDECDARQADAEKEPT